MPTEIGTSPSSTAVGIVDKTSPVGHRHGQSALSLATWIAAYRVGTPGGGGGLDATVRREQDIAPQPVALLRVDTACGVMPRIADDGYLEGPPELIAEEASSSVSYDLNEKLHAYRLSGV